MKVVIVEDEFVAARNLERMIHTVDGNMEILTVLQSVEECIEWFSINSSPDVVFMDIHLADGDVFRFLIRLRSTARLYLLPRTMNTH